MPPSSQEATGSGRKPWISRRRILIGVVLLLVLLVAAMTVRDAMRPSFQVAGRVRALHPSASDIAVEVGTPVHSIMKTVMERVSIPRCSVSANPADAGLLLDMAVLQDRPSMPGPLLHSVRLVDKLSCKLPDSLSVDMLDSPLLRHLGSFGVAIPHDRRPVHPILVSDLPVALDAFDDVRKDLIPLRVPVDL